VPGTTDVRVRGYRRPVRLHSPPGAATIHQFRRSLRDILVPAKIPVISQIGTVKVGICTLFFLACSCAFLTFWYEHTEEVLGKSWFIRVPLVVLALNLLSITITRFRRSWSQAGMISTHAGLITILVGSFLTCVMGTTGTLQFSEGDTVAKYFDEMEVFAVKENPDASPLQQQVAFAAAPDREECDVGFDVPGGTTVSVSKYYHHYREQTSMENDSPTPNPCLWLRVASQAEGTGDLWLFEGQDKEHQGMRIDGVPVLMFYASIGGDAELAKAAASVAAKRMGEISVQVKGQPKGQVLEVISSIGKDVPIEGTPYTLRLDKFLPSFQHAEDGQDVSRDDHPRNPMVQATLSGGPTGAQKMRIFGPGIEPPHGGQPWPEGISVHYNVIPYLQFLRLADGRHFVIGSALDDPAKPLELKTAEPIEIAWLGTMMQGHYLDHAKQHTKAENASEQENPAVQVTVRHGGASKTVWVLRGDEESWTPIKVGEAEVEVGYQRVVVPHAMPFALTLQKFVEQHYEGTATPSAWESHVAIADAEHGENFNYTIAMNEPLAYRGWKLFQSGKNQDPQTGAWTSTLSVSWDPGRYLVYPGCGFVVAGVLFLFYAKKHVLRWESRRLEAKGAIPKASISPAAAPEPAAAEVKSS